MGGNRLPGQALGLVTGVQLLKLGAVNVGQTRRDRGAHEGPLGAILDAFHEQVGDPHGGEQVASASLLVPLIESQLQKLKDVGVPGLQVHGDGPLALARLIDVAGSGVVHAQHGDDAVGNAVGPLDDGTIGANIVHVQTDAARPLADIGTLLESVVNAVDAVLLGGQEKATRHLGALGPGVEQGGRGVNKLAEGETLIGLHDPRNVVHVYAHGHAHEHELGRLAIHEVTLFQRF